MAGNAIAAHVLMKKGKRGAADYVHSNPQHLSDLLDLILNPKKPIDEWETIDWVKWLMAGGRTPDEFTSIVLRYDNSMTCGLVWTANYVAYRCRTCGISPCMSLCAQCFQKGDHAGHDFNMFKSQAGGACDCGDMSVMKETGFCERHGPKATVSKPAAPGDLMCTAHGVVPRIILRLIQHLRDNSAGSGADAILLAVQDADAFLSMMHELSAMGAAMRRVLTGALTNPQMYKLLAGETTAAAAAADPDADGAAASASADYAVDSQRLYAAALASVPNPAPPDEYRDCPALQEFLVHRSFLEELVFWTVKFEFPQKMVCLLLNMLPDPDYKEALTQAFVLHYSRISMMLERSLDPDTLSNRVVHVSVQLFSNEALALRMTEKLNLLHVMVVSLKYMMANILIDHTLHDSAKNFHRVVDCSRQVMKEHCYWPLVSDLNNVLGHAAVAVKFMSDDGLLEMWFAFLSMFQGMNVNQRELTAHVEFEPNTYYAAFSAELEASAYPMWALVSHLHDPSTVALTRRVLASCLTALQDWLDAVDYTTPRINDSMQVSFHLPLHRYLAVLLCQAVKTQGLALRDVLPPRDMLSLAMMHPLRVQVAFYEVLTGMWVRNGLQIKGQAMTYIQCNFCNSMVDADLFLLQVCATQLPPDAFLETVIDKFHVAEWMSLSPVAEANSAFVEGDQETPMLESCLTFLATLMCVRTNLGETDSACSQLEMVTLLCMGDKTHSQLMELMPERCGTAQSRDFESVLADVADYKAPNLDASGNMQQGMYVPTAAVWTEMYDPVHVLLRAVHRRDFQTSMDRFTEFAVQSGALKAGAAPWPPFRPPAPVHDSFEDPRRVLRSRVFHAACFVVLHKAVHSAAVSEHVTALTIFLLEMAVATAEPRDQHTQVCYANRGEREIKDKELSTWYESDWLSCNLRTIVRFVKMEPEPAVVFDSDDSDAEWESTEMDDTESCSEPRPPRIGAPPPLPFDLPLTEAGVAGAAGAAGGAAGGGGAGFQLVAVGASASSSASSSQTTPTDGQLVPSRLPALPSPDSPQRALGPGAGQAVALPGETLPALLALTEGAGTSATGADAAPAQGASSQVVSALMAGPGSARQLSSLYRQLAVRRGGGGGGSAGGAGGADLPHPRRQPSAGKRRQVQGNARWSGDQLEVQESLISLLLKLHCHLAGTPDSFAPDEPTSAGGGGAAEDSRVGDGRFFVGKLLNRICQLDSLCREDVLQTRERLWPKQQQEECEEEQREREAKEREDRRRRAKERQQKLMEEFADRQKQFMERAMETDEEGVGGAGAGMDWSEAGAVPLASKKEYDCVICSQTTPSSEDKPMGLVVLVQASSVLGHRQRTDDGPRLPTTDAERVTLKQADRQAAHFDRRLEELSREFDASSWQVSVSLGWEGGVHLQTCGHHLHLDCLKAYLHSLRTQQRQQSIAVERGEYWCPLCRQLANSVLPLSPRLGECAAVVRSRPAPMVAVVAELARLLKENPPAPVASSLAEAMAKSMEDMTESTAHKFKQKSASPTSQSLFLFVSSIARTNLEVELVQRGGSLVDPAAAATPVDAAAAAAASLTPKRSCIVPLLHVLAMHARLLACWPTWPPLLALAGQPDEGGASREALALAPLPRQVPLLLRDPAAMLTQFVLLLPLHLDLTHFSCVVKLLYNALYVQAAAQVCCALGEASRARYRRPTGGGGGGGDPTLDAVMALLVGATDAARMFIDEDAAAGAGTRDAREDLGPREVELEVQRLCVPFLRTAALLRHHLYEQPLPAVASPRAEFVRLVYFLELVTDGMDWHRFNAAAALNWVQDDGLSTAAAWAEELAAFAARCPLSARSLLAEQHVGWHPPRLLGLPQLYDHIFQFYQAMACSQCQSVPRETSVCLLCGALVCLKENCCKQLNVCEAVHHSVECGGGTGVFLVVTSSYVIVVRGKRACLWGSVYLDSHGEEDRELKRGKPLTLSAGRYRLLEQQWLAHRFDHTNKKWVWHRDAL